MIFPGYRYVPQRNDGVWTDDFPNSVSTSIGREVFVGQAAVPFAVMKVLRSAVFAVPVFAGICTVMVSCCEKQGSSAAGSVTARNAGSASPVAVVRMALERKSITQEELSALIALRADDLPDISWEAIRPLDATERFDLLKLLIPHLKESAPHRDRAWYLLISMQGSCPPPDVKVWEGWIKEQTPQTVTWFVP